MTSEYIINLGILVAGGIVGIMLFRELIWGTGRNDEDSAA